MASLYNAASAAKGKRKANDDDQDGASTTAPAVRRNKQRVLLLPSRGITSRMRHLVNDFEVLLPHAKRDSKLDSKSQLHLLNELAELNNCNNTLYFEARKHEDLYLWAAKTPNGPSVKMHVQNIHTMDELKMTGNCLKGSRPILSFSEEFDKVPHWTLLKELFTQIFGVPRGARRSKPFIDHVLSFSICDGKIWFRNYQIVENDPGATAVAAADIQAESGKASQQKKKERDAARQPTLTEIGPRMVMTPIRIFEGSFGGATLFENAEYVSPNAVRHAMRRERGTKYSDRTTAQVNLREKKEMLREAVPEDELAARNVFA